MANNLKIVQHNVLHWSGNRKIELSNYYQQESPDIILLNSTSIPDSERIKIFTYKIYQRNYLGENQAGVAIGVKYNIKHRVIDDFQEDLLGIELETSRGPIVIATTYLPPRRNYLPRNEIMRLMRRTLPVYLMGDLNARHHFLGHEDQNVKGTSLNNLINQGHISHLGPDFSTLTVRRGRPDIVL